MSRRMNDAQTYGRTVSWPVQSSALSSLGRLYTANASLVTPALDYCISHTSAAFGVTGTLAAIDTFVVHVSDTRRRIWNVLHLPSVYVRSCLLQFMIHALHTAADFIDFMVSSVHTVMSMHISHRLPPNHTRHQRYSSAKCCTRLYSMCIS